MKRPGIDVKPRQLGEIRNFGRVHMFMARGEQPLNEDYPVLKREGVKSVISLREAFVEKRTVAGRLFPEYRVENEKRLCLNQGIYFRHVPCTDNMGLSVEEVVRVLEVLDEEYHDGRMVYLHCLLGVGRTGIATAAWLISRGESGNEAAQVFKNFSMDIYRRAHNPDEDEVSFFRRVGTPKQWWVLQTVAKSLGDPITEEFPCVSPESPDEAEQWETEAMEKLRPWREKRTNYVGK